MTINIKAHDSATLKTDSHPPPLQSTKPDKSTWDFQKWNCVLRNTSEASRNSKLQLRTIEVNISSEQNLHLEWTKVHKKAKYGEF